jgi:hypothetical protein
LHSTRESIQKKVLAERQLGKNRTAPYACARSTGENGLPDGVVCVSTVRLICVPALALFCATPLGAQLRPLEPLDWSAFTTAQKVHAHVRIGVHGDQRASLAGTTGSLVELGELRL